MQPEGDRQGADRGVVRGRAGEAAILAALDSATPPTAAQAAQAKAGGVSLWNGYIASKPGVGLLRPWKKTEFDIARSVGGTPVAYASGHDDPAALKTLAAAWNVKLCLDVENGIRGDGPWVQPWLDASSAGLYGNMPVFTGRNAPFFILAGYTVHDPKATWDGAPPAAPHGWQWQNSHNEFGVTVDRCWFDDWFGPAPAPQPHPLEDEHMRVIFWATLPGGGNAAFLSTDAARFRHIKSPAELDHLQGAGGVFQTLTGKACPVWDNGNPVGDVGAFGVPEDKATADVLGLPFP